MSVIAIDGCAVATVDPADTEFASGHVVLDGMRIAAVGSGPLPEQWRRVDGIEVVDARGLLVTPGLVNTHHHLYQWITRGYAVDDTLFGWLATLYPIWARLTADTVYASAAANLGWLALTGTTTTTDHHYVHPAGAGDLLEAEILAAQQLGLRFHPTRGSMDLGESAGGLPPDEVVEDPDTVLAATEAAIDRWHDPSPESMLRIAVAPCSPFSATPRLMRESAELARRRGVRLHTHLAETKDEDAFCQATYGRSPVEYAADLGWLGPDVWLAHCVHLSDADVRRFGETGTGVAHCPTSNGRLGSGIAPVRGLLAAGAPVGLGVDGSASNESGRMVDELHQSLLAARYREGPLAVTSRQVLRMATMGGARCLGRQDELGSLEVGRLADIAVWRVDDLPGAGIADPVCTLVFGAPSLVHLYVGGRPVVAAGRLLTADPGELAAGARTGRRVRRGRLTRLSRLRAGEPVDLTTVTDLLPAGTTAWQPGDAFLAGGTWLFSEPQPGVRRLLDLSAHQWPPFTINEQGLEIAATCTFAELADVVLPEDWTAAPLIGRCVDSLWGSWKIRALATVGGNICCALPAGPMTSLASSLDGVADLIGADGSTRTLPVADIVTGPARTALRPGELVRAVRLPVAPLRNTTAFRRISLTPLGRSGALVVGCRSPADGSAVVTVTASVPRPLQLRFPAVPAPEVALAALDAAAPVWYDDVHGLPAWRAAMTGKFVAEVVTELAR